jgi:prepilin-type N-terminal cleavage/methylation domain-containing protein
MTPLQAQSDPRTRRGFTLLETLGVITLMALIAALTSRGLSGATDDSRRRAALSAVRTVDATGRLLAASGPVELIVAEDRGALVLRRDSRVVIVHALPAHCKAHLLMDDQPIASITYSSVGTTADFTVYIELPDVPLALNVAGLTGWIEAREVAP